MVYKWYILPIGGLYGTYHLLREPGNSIDNVAGLTRGNQCLTSPDHKALYPRGGYVTGEGLVDRP